MRPNDSIATGEPCEFNPKSGALAWPMVETSTWFCAFAPAVKPNRNTPASSAVVARTRGTDTCFRLCERLHAAPEVVLARVTVLLGPAEGGRQVLVSGTPYRRAIPTRKRTAVIIGITAGKPVVPEPHRHDPDPVVWAIPVRPDSIAVILQVAE